MKLADAASYFDRTPVTDPNGGFLFYGQVDPYDDARRDSNSAYRRILSVKPGTTMPPSLVGKLFGQVWLIGNMEPDGMLELHREKYVIQHAASQLKVSRLSGFLAGTVASTLWASPIWVKDDKQLVVSSTTPQIFDVTLPATADVRVQDILWGGGAAYLVLSPHLQASGFVNAISLKLDQPLPLPATLTTRAYVPTTGAYTSSTPITVNALKVVWQHLFEYGSQTSERYQEGDVAIALPTGTAVTTSTLVTLSGVTHQVLAVLSLGAAVVLHARVT